MHPLGGSLPFGSASGDGSDNQPSRNEQQPQRRSATLSPTTLEQHLMAHTQRQRGRATGTLQHPLRTDVPLQQDQLDAAAALQGNPYYWTGLPLPGAAYPHQPPFLPSLNSPGPSYPTRGLPGSSSGSGGGGGGGGASASFVPPEPRESSLAAAYPPNWRAAASLQQRGEASSSSNVTAARGYEGMQYLPQANQYYQQQHARASTFARPSNSSAYSPVVPHTRLPTSGAQPSHAFDPASNSGSANLPRSGGVPLAMPSHNSGFPTPSLLGSPAPLPPVPLHAPTPAVPLPPGAISSTQPPIPPAPPPAAAAPEVRTRRAIIACRFCRSRKLRCDGEERCRQCARRGEECVYTLPPAAQRRADGKSEAAAAAAAAIATVAASGSSSSGSASTSAAPQLPVARKTGKEVVGKAGGSDGSAGRAAKRRGGPAASGSEEQSAGSSKSEASTLQNLPLAYGGAAAAASTASPASSRASYEESSLGRAASLRHPSEASSYSTDLRTAYAASGGAGPSTAGTGLRLDVRAPAEASLLSPATPRYATATPGASPLEPQPRPFPSVLYQQGEQPGPAQAHVRPPSPAGSLASALDGTAAASWPPRPQHLPPPSAPQRHPPPPPRGASFPPHQPPPRPPPPPKKG